MTFTTTGAAQMVQALEGLSKRMTRAVMVEALTDAAEPARKRMSELAPRHPGAPDLADHIVISSFRARGTEYAVGIGPSRPFFYGYFLEFGTAHHGAYPFVRPAIDQMRGAMLQRLKLSFWAAMTRRGFGPARGASGTGTL